MTNNLPDSGVFIINKEAGHSSQKLVNYIKKITGKKTGHGGTLDPMACGVLVVAFGQATRLLEYALAADKEYIFQINWGNATDSYDAEGQITDTTTNIPSKSEIINVLEQFRGQIWQSPPRFSALKISGQPAYKLARSGVELSLKKRQVEIKSLELIEHKQNLTHLKSLCTKGTYIRSLAHDLALSLDSFGHVDFLQRTATLGFALEQSITLNLENKEQDFTLLKNNYLPAESLVPHLEIIELSEAEFQKLKFGQNFQRNNLHFKEETFMRANFRNNLIGIVRVDQQTIYPRKTFVNR